MSLIVLAEHYDAETGKIGESIWPDDCSELAGFESFRYEVWGHESLVRRGAHFLPQLLDSFLYVYPDELDAFEKECLMLLAETDNIMNEKNPPLVDAEGFRRRVGNFLKAIKTARSINGVVYIG